MNPRLSYTPSIGQLAFEANYKNKPYEKEKLFQYILSVKINEVPCVEFLFSVRFIKKREGNYIKRRNCYGVASVSNLDSLSADIKNSQWRYFLLKKNFLTQIIILLIKHLNYDICSGEFFTIK